MHRLRNPGAGGTVSLPAVGKLINQPGYTALVADFGRASVVAALREQVATERNGTAVTDQERLNQVESSLRKQMAPVVQRVINASGVILHTNLGRAPLSRAAVDAVAAAAAASTAARDSGARPRLVWRITPLALMTLCSTGAICLRRLDSTWLRRSWSVTAVPFRSVATCSLNAATTLARPKSATRAV